MELTVYNIKGEDTGRKVQLNDDIYGIEPNEHVMYLAVRQYLADQQEDLHRIALYLCPQEIERAVRAFDLQAFARHLQLDFADDRRTDEAGAPQWCGSRNQIVIKPI